jgi:hypothetical protein
MTLSHFFLYSLGALVLGWMVLRKPNVDQLRLRFKLWHILWPPFVIRHLTESGNANVGGKVNGRRQKILFALFLLILLLAFFFDPFRKFG